MKEFSEKGKLCLDWRIKSGVNLIGKESVTLEIWKVNVFLFSTKIQSNAPLPLTATGKFLPNQILANSPSNFSSLRGFKWLD